MVEYYGWVRIRDNTYETNLLDLERIKKEIESIAEEIKFEGRIFELRGINGRYILSTAGSANRKRKDVMDIVELFKTIPKIAPGSYGILYLWDDEAEKEGKEDEFQVFKIVKGKFSKEKDDLFSPCSEKIFDDQTNIT